MTAFQRRAKIWLIWLLILAVLILLAVLFTAAGWLQDWLWMGQVGYSAVFWRIWTIKFVAFLASWLITLGVVWLNLHLALKTVYSLQGQRQGGQLVVYTKDGLPLPRRLTRAGGLLAALIIGLVFATVFYHRWDVFLRFLWAGDYGQHDPLYAKDIGFYLFRLPFYKLLQSTLTGLIFIVLAAAAAVYGYFKVFRLEGFRDARMDRAMVGHLSLLLALWAAGWGWGYYLDRYGLLLAARGVVFGAGFTAFHFERIGYWIMVLAIAAYCLFTAWCYIKKWVVPVLIGAGCILALHFLVLILIPGLVQKFKVEPSELELETPFLKHNINFTRQAFQLDKIVEKAYPAVQDLTLTDIDKHRGTIDNIRLWDWRPILQTYRQTQEIRLYYEFYAVDVDRYHLKDGYRQVMLSARELAAQLPPKARTWLNERLQFTHGYGLVMSFVSAQKEGGLPVYAIENIPPVSDDDLKVDQPAVYYGEATPGYRIVNTQVNEFDFPRGNDNVYTKYTGRGGIALDNIVKKVLFAWTQGDINILLSAYLTPDSRIQIYRNVQERVSRIAPFLLLDRDPYLVLADGRLFWIQDAYTHSDRFPYAQPSDVSQTHLNYIRNSVKAVVDVYDGSVTFYMMDAAEPVLGVYRRAFPGMFKAFADLPPALKTHLRYPEDLFNIQANVYMNYHMTDPQVFYNQEDLWTLPREKYAGQAVDFQPYYILMRLPGTPAVRYFLMMPFTPQGRDNMISWMGAQCDFPDYGHITVYQLPKEHLTFGPLQIEAMIDQNARISEQLSLWDQRGSRVIRGNLLVIPIENAFLYAEPVYLLAEGVNIPQLIRVIVISGNKVVMEPTLEQAIATVFKASPPTAPLPASTAEPGAAVMNRARSEFNKAQDAMQSGQWKDFGEAMDALKQILTTDNGKEPTP